MKIEYDPAKRAQTLHHRGLDFAWAPAVFATATATIKDTRLPYVEERFITIGYLESRMVVMVWTPRGASRRIISMRKANEREIIKYS